MSERRQQREQQLAEVCRQLDEQHPRAARRQAILSSALDEALSTRTVGRVDARRGRSSGRVIAWVFAPTLAAAAALVLLWLAPWDARRDSEPTLHSESATEHIAGARVERLNPTELSWDEATNTLRVGEGGAIRVSLSPGRPRPFRVEMSRFVVEVTGTVFVARPEGVQVQRGSVRVLSGGEVVRERLSAGQTWSVDSDVQKDEEGAAEPKQRKSASGADAPLERDGPDVRALLDRAAEHVGRGEPDAARSLLRKVLASEPSPKQQARAEVLLADCAQLDGQAQEAGDLYQRGAGNKQDEQQAQAALFSAARLAADQGNAERAKTLFKRYLQEYPRGALRRQARRRLHELESADR